MDEINLWFEKMLYDGIKKIEIEYSGYGDSGNITRTEDVSIKDNPMMIEIPDNIQTFFLEKIQSDWYNNEGGQGIITINTKQKSWKIKEGYNYTTTKYIHTKGKLGE